MKTITKHHVYGRPAGKNERFLFGNAVESENYGKVELVRKTVTHHIVSQEPCRGRCGAASCPASESVEVLAVLDAEAAAHVVGTLTDATVQSLTLKKAALS